MNDLLIFHQNMGDINELWNKSKEKFVPKSLGEPKQFLNKELNWTKNGAAMRLINLIRK